MKRKLLHIVFGVIAIIGTCSSVMATEIEEVAEETIVIEVTEESSEVDAEIVDTTEVAIEEDAVVLEEESSIIIEEVKVSTGEKVAEYAKQFIGTPYVYGGNNLNTGVDCSGFTQQVYKNFSVNLQRRARDQYAKNGYTVSKADLKEGDLVFYGYSSVCHVAIYVGNGEVIHAPVPGKSVCVVPLWQRGDAPIIGYKRIFND